MRSPDEIKKGLECCQPRYENDHWLTCNSNCPYHKEAPLCHKALVAGALAYIQQLEERCKTLEYTLLGVMHSVDKWLSVEPYDFDKDDGTVAATRASEAREVALTAIENLQSRLAQVELERDAAVHDMENYAGYGAICKHFDNDCPHIVEGCPLWPSDCESYEWRGVCPENTKEDTKE